MPHGMKPHKSRTDALPVFYCPLRSFLFIGKRTTP